MERLLLVVALALSGCLAAAVLSLRSRTEARRLAGLNHTPEARVADRTRELSRSLPAADDQARRLALAGQAKSDFLAAMSHELRTPLTAVIGFAELLRLDRPAEPLSRRQSQAVDHILASARQLQSLVEAVLDLAGAEAGRLAVSIETVDPQLVVRDVCDQLELHARAAGVTVRTPAPTAGLGVAADPVRLRQVLLNLVSNAIAYNREGGDVLVEIRQTAAGATLAVHDTGVGIAEARMADLFQPFNRLGRETSATPGAGIGLALSRRLVEAMGGRLEAASEAGEGSTFTLHLPLARAAVSPVQASAIPLGSLPAATVLYVEDHPSNIALMRHVMAALGPVQLHVAETGPDGLALARDLKPDVILTDINLPGLSGFELKARLDADPLTRGIPVLALTASALPGDVRRGKAAGFRDYLTKPLDIVALAAALNRALGTAEADASSRAA
jgi:signal transduction histidine kinase/CheY-like chemotaxis protein